MPRALLALATFWLAVDLTGAWTLDLDPDFGGVRSTVDCSFKQDGQTLTADCGGAPISGELDGRKVVLRVKTGQDNELTATFAGELDAREATITGTWQLADSAGKREGRFTATRR